MIALAVALLVSPAPDAPIPAAPRPLAAALRSTERALDTAIDGWNRSVPPPREVSLLALYEQRIFRTLGDDRRLAHAVVKLDPAAADDVAARSDLASLAAHSAPLRAAPRVGPAPPANRLRAWYGEAQARFGIRWQLLAAVNFVESAFGKVRNASTAGAQGPMQFEPATWRAYGLGGNVHDPRDAILGAANYLAANRASTERARRAPSVQPLHPLRRRRHPLREPDDARSACVLRVLQLVRLHPHALGLPASDGPALMRTVATIGVYGWTLETSSRHCTRADVGLVVDVRQRRGVRGSEYAWANAGRLQAALAEAGVRYSHHMELAPTTELRQLQYREDDRLGVGKRSRAELAPEYRERYICTRSSTGSILPEFVARASGRRVVRALLRGARLAGMSPLPRGGTSRQGARRHRCASAPRFGQILSGPDSGPRPRPTASAGLQRIWSRYSTQAYGRASGRLQPGCSRRPAFTECLCDQHVLGLDAGSEMGCAGEVAALGLLLELAAELGELSAPNVAAFDFKVCAARRTSSASTACSAASSVGASARNVSTSSDRNSSPPSWRSSSSAL